MTTEKVNKAAGLRAWGLGMGPWLALAGLLIPAAAVASSDPFAPPRPDELAMKSVPGYDGVPAVVLFREQIDDGNAHTSQRYDRIKILSEEGKKYANVELAYTSVSMFDRNSNFDMKVDGIYGRTIHADGTVVPFTGKPYMMTEEKVKGVKVQVKVFTLPEAEVGSVLEYRYTIHREDYLAPDWYVQGELFVKSAHYKWIPTSDALVDSSESPVNEVNWFPVLPPGSQVVKDSKHRSLELTVSDIPPSPQADFMPPSASYTYRVLFNYTKYKSRDDYWKMEGQLWSKAEDEFMQPNKVLKSETQKIVDGAATQDEKLRRIYAAVMALENTDYTRERDRREDKAAGLKEIKSAADLYLHKRGDSYELTKLFVAMARAAGLNAYLTCVPDRERDLFVLDWWNTHQFDHLLAIVAVDGKERYFDPGSADCPYGKLGWQYTFVTGMRQTPGGGSGFEVTPGQSWKDNQTNRVANLEMDAHGEVTGTIDLSFAGAPALYWRQKELMGDEQGLRQDLRDALAEMLPKTLEANVSEIRNLGDYEKPLTVTFLVKGSVGVPAGKRLVVPADIFLVGEGATFPAAKRDLPVYFHYPQWMQDAIQIKFPAELGVEAAPSPAKLQLEKFALYTMGATSTEGSFTTRRNYLFADVFVLPEKYQELRDFYSSFESNDQQSVVLKAHL